MPSSPTVSKIDPVPSPQGEYRRAGTLVALVLGQIHQLWVVRSLSRHRLDGYMVKKCRMRLTLQQLPEPQVLQVCLALPVRPVGLLYQYVTNLPSSALVTCSYNNYMVRYSSPTIDQMMGMLRVSEAQMLNYIYRVA